MREKRAICGKSGRSFVSGFGAWVDVVVVPTIPSALARRGVTKAKHQRPWTFN
jgi:hypothetical protein